MPRSHYIGSSDHATWQKDCVFTLLYSISIMTVLLCMFITCSSPGWIVLPIDHPVKEAPIYMYAFLHLYIIYFYEIWVWRKTQWNSFSLFRVFLVRDSQSNPRTFVLSMSHRQKIKHFQIIPVSNCDFRFMDWRCS